jgi:hypothetical protein
MKCFQCGATWSDKLPAPTKCPSCASSWYDKSHDVENFLGVGNTYVIRAAETQSGGIIRLELESVGSSHRPSLPLEGYLAKEVQTQAKKLGSGLSSLVGLHVRFGRTPKGGTSLTIWTPPAR